MSVPKGARRTEGDPTDIFPASMTVLIWSATANGRPLRRLMIDYYTSTVTAPLIEKHIEEYHPEFVQELMLKSFGIHHNTERDVFPTAMRDDYYHEDVALDAAAQEPYLHTIAGSVKVTLTNENEKLYHAQGASSDTP